MNYYEINWPIQFSKLKTLLNNHIHGYSFILKRKENIDLLYWINDVTNKKLSNKNFSLSTKCYWIINGLVDYPKCLECKKDIIDNVKNINLGYHIYCSRYCKLHSKLEQQKREQTMIKKYGSNNAFNKDCKLFEHKYDKISKKLGYKITNSIQIPGVKEKIQDSLYKKYGVNNISKIKEVQQKKIKTFNAKYNSNSFFGSKQFLNKTKSLYMERFGVENYSQTTEYKQKSKQTCIRKYGVEHAMQNTNIRIKSQQRYTYNNIHFDSSPELAFYIWLKDNNIKFEYQPNISFEYEVDRKKHYYMPDFKVEDQYIELKGNQFLKEDGTWQNPYDHTQDMLYELKHQCLLKNNIKILYSNDYQKYINYINNKYGKEYLSTFKNSKQL